MKLILKINILVVFLITFFPSSSTAQFGHEWIDFTKPYFKLKVAEDGIYRVPLLELKKVGIPIDALSNSNYKILCGGKEVILNIKNGYIEFYGEKNKGALDSPLFEFKEYQKQFDYSMYTDTAIYYLTYDASYNGVRYQTVTSPTPELPEVEYYLRKQRIEYRDFTWVAVDLSSHPYITPGEGLQSGFIGTWMGNGLTMNFQIPDYFATTKDTGKINTVVYGRNNGPIYEGVNQHAAIYYNNGVWASILDDYFLGYKERTYSVNFNNTFITSSKTLKLGIRAVQNYYDQGKKLTPLLSTPFVEVIYPASFNSSTGNYIYNVKREAADRKILFTNFSGSKAVALDPVNGLSFNTSVSSSNVEIKLPNSKLNHKIVFFDESTVKFVYPQPFTMPKINVIDPETNYLIITSKKLRNSVREFESYKETPEGGNFKVQVIYSEDLYDVYYYGVHHALAIKNFIKEVYASNKNLEHVFFIGKGLAALTIAQPNLRDLINRDLVPTLGNPSSDMFYGSYLLKKDNIIPPFGIGRIAAEVDGDVINYLNKLKTYNALGNGQWRKNILHISGGKDDAEFERFKSYMKALENIIEGPSIGGTVTYYGKENSEAVSTELTKAIIDKTNNGVGLVSYFGHAGANTPEVDMGDVLDYNNSGKPTIYLFGGCLLGQCFSPDKTISERFIENSNGAIAWIASSDFSYEPLVKDYMIEIYRQMSHDSYGIGIGQTMNAAADYFVQNNDKTRQGQALFTILQGDPSVSIYSPEFSDFSIKDNSIYISPENVTAQNDFFTVNAIVQNLGKVSEDSVLVDIHVEYSNFTGIDSTFLVPPIKFNDTVQLVVKNPDHLFGQITVSVNVDPKDTIVELDEKNNNATAYFNILSNSAVGLYPSSFSIVSKAEVELIAQSLDLNSSKNTFFFEIDTVPSFSSPWRKRSPEITGKLFGNWKVKLIPKDTQAYYWRTRLMLKNGTLTPWSSLSFTQIKDGYDGWAQVDIRQFNTLKSNFLLVDTVDREFKFAQFTSGGTFKIENCGVNCPSEGFYQFGSKLSGKIDGKGIAGSDYSQISNTNTFNGMVAYALNPNTLQTYKVPNGISNNNGVYFFDWMKSEIEINPTVLDSFISFLERMPAGYHLMMYSGYYHRIGDMPERFYKAVESFGSSKIRQVKNNGVWLLIGTKGGRKKEAVEQYTESTTNPIIGNKSFAVLRKEGTLRTNPIGPSKKWRLIDIQTHSLDGKNTKDFVNFSIYGINNNNKKVLLVSNFTNPKLDISFIDASTYPYIELEMYSNDFATFTPTQLDHWIVYYDYLPEGAINSEIAYVFNSDTLDMGQNLHIEIGYQNISNLSLDSMDVVYEVADKNRKVVYSEHEKIKPLGPGAKYIITKNIATNEMVGENKISIKTNPNFLQPELYLFNNNFERSFFVAGDRQQPSLDVTFDNVRIFNGDYVSPNPTIQISGKDNNQFFTISDPSYFTVFLITPSDPVGYELSIPSDDIQFTPATSSNSSAIIKYTPNLEDGQYTLRAQLKDEAGNTAGKISYEVNFQVVSNSEISNLYAFPNPFTRTTQFQFTITGNKVPDNIALDIFNSTGQLVREVSFAEIGPLKIGYNVSHFIWDGTDMNGNQVGTGLYLYKVKIMQDDNELKPSNIGNTFYNQEFGKILYIK